MRAVGVDPGLANTGLALVEETPNNYRCLGVRYVKTKANKRRAHNVRTDTDDLERMGVIQDALSRALEKGQPHCAGIETYIIAGDKRASGLAKKAGGNAWKVSIVYGHCCATLRLGKLCIYPHAPGELKMTIAGYPQASKKAIEESILDVVEGAEDAMQRAEVLSGEREHVFDAIGHAILALRIHRKILGPAAPPR